MCISDVKSQYSSLRYINMSLQLFKNAHESTAKKSAGLKMSDQKVSKIVTPIQGII